MVTPLVPIPIFVVAASELWDRGSSLLGSGTWWYFFFGLPLWEKVILSECISPRRGSFFLQSSGHPGDHSLVGRLLDLLVLICYLGSLGIARRCDM